MDRGALARWGITHQVFKSALAASSSYAAAEVVVGHGFPVFAPMAALLTIQINVYNSFARGVQRILAIIVGIGVAMLAFHFTGANWWIIFIVVFLTLMVGTRMGLGIAAINQVPMSALLILAAKAYVPTYALDRIINTIIGTLIAALINLILWPPNGLPAARTALRTLQKSIEQLLQLSAQAISQTDHAEEGGHSLMTAARKVDAQVAKAKSAVAAAGQSLKLNPLGRRHQADLQHCQEAMNLLERVGVQTRGIAKSIVELRHINADLPDPDTLSHYLRAVADVLDAAIAPDNTPESQGNLGQAFQSAQELYHRYTSTALQRLSHQPDTWPRVGSILADSNHMLTQLKDQAHP